MNPAAARELFATGWAASGGPLTDRVRAGSVACQHLADELTEEATLRLGHLEGVWAAIYDRRLKLLNIGVSKAKAVWAANPPDFPELVRQVRVNMGLGEATPAKPPTAITVLAGEALLRPLTKDDLTLILSEDYAAAVAEGQTGALALGADSAGYLGFDFDLAFQDAVDALGGLDASVWTDAVAGYVQDALDASVRDLGNLLARLVTDQASYADMLTAVEDLFGNANAIGYIVDLALSTGLTQGALALYTSEGVAEVNFVTAGDERVCDLCDAAEVGGPYDITLPFPQPPLHGFCRCCLQANDTLPSSAFTQYVTDQLDEG